MIFKKKVSFFKKYIGVFLLVLLSACSVENLDAIINSPKTDFSSFNYVLATEDASDVDITTFFAFNPESINPETVYDPMAEDGLFVNSNPSTSSGSESINQYIFSLAKDKKNYSSTPGLYRLTLNENNRVYIDSELHISRDNLFPARQLCIVNSQLGYFYDEGKEAYSIQIFNPTEMRLLGSIDLKPAISTIKSDIKWVDESGNNLVRTGTLVLEEHGGKLYVSVVFLEAAGFNLIHDSENHFYLTVIDIESQEVEKVISYEGAQTVGFFVSENKATVKDREGNLYFCSWGWNQFNQHKPSKVFRIKNGETDFDSDWIIDIEKLFGKDQIAQSIAAYNDKLYLHVSTSPYTFSEDDPAGPVRMAYYEIDPYYPDKPIQLDIPESNTSSRMSVFSMADGKLYISVPNIERGKFNGMYSLNKNGGLEKELSVDNKYRPTRLFKLHI